MEEARWFLADLVLEHRVAGEDRNVVHVNTVLVEAEGSEQAWERAMALGRESEWVYQNTDGQEVQVLFRGLLELLPLQDELEHGGELRYTERVGVSEETLVELIPPKHELSAFAPLPDLDDLLEPDPDDEGPNLMPVDVAQALEQEELSGFGALQSADPGRSPSPESLRFARHAALVAASELRRQGLTEQAKGAEYLAEALEHLIAQG